jgi:hypothetical protein
MSDNVVKFPGNVPKRGRAVDDEPEIPNLRNDWRSPEGVKRQIAKHVAARNAYAKAVAWTIVAEEQNLPPAQIEQARQDTAELYQEMQECVRSLVISMPTDPRALVDLLLYLEKHFTTIAGVRPVAYREALASPDRTLRQVR